MTNLAHTTDEIKAALKASASSVESLTYTHFDGGIEHTGGGDVRTTSWRAWVQTRRAAAAELWPTAESIYRCQAELDAYPDDEREARIAAAISEAKMGLPVEVGAALTEGRRKDKAVTGITWLFIDIDGVNVPGVEAGDTVRELHKLLVEAGVNHLITESPTSRLHRNAADKLELRIHCYVQLAPVLMPTAAQVQSFQLVKDWWRRIYAAATTAIVSAVGLGAKEDAAPGRDTSVDDMSQPCFVAYVPPGCAGRAILDYSDGLGLDVERFVTTLGVDATRPWEQGAAPVRVAAPETAPRMTTMPEVVQTTTKSLATPDGPTPGHTTGSLIMRVAKHYGYLGKPLGDGKYAVRCPWAELHKSDPRQVMGHLDSSTTLWDNVTSDNQDGGFDCKHNGCRLNGQKRTAADVLSWARKKGIPESVLPNKSTWDGGGATAAADDDDVETAAPKPKRSRDDRPTIYVRDADVAGMRDAAIRVLGTRGDIFVRDGVLCDLTPQGPRPIPSDHLLAVLGETARWLKRSRNADGDLVEKPAKVPRDVVGAVLKAPAWPGINELRAVVKHPPLLPDGRLITAPGYDAESKLLYLPDAEFNIPVRPTRDDAVAARDRLLSKIRHTNFVDKNGQSIWLAFTLSLAARSAFPTLPVFGFDAAVAGAGKTSLVKIAYGLVHGELPQLGAPVVDDDAEAEKRLPTWARMPLVCWDNVKHTFGSPVVDGAITAGRATTRRLGASESMTFDFSATSWAMTGNNLAVGDDAASRTLIARIAAPTTRKYDFAVDDAVYYKAQRPQAVADALTILRAFIVAGSPQEEDVPYCRFVEWSRLIRQSLLWIGMPDPVGGEVVDSTLEGKAAALRALGEWQRHRVADWEQTFFAADLDTALTKYRSEDDETFRLRRAATDAIAAVYGRKVDSSAKVGYALQKLRDLTIPATEGGLVRFIATKAGAKTAYRLEWERGEASG